MWPVDPDRQREALTECGYSFPTEVVADVQGATATYRDLHLYVGIYCYTNMEKKKLVNLSGTIPVVYKGLMYNIPVCIWLHKTHPQNPPKCLVRPSVSMVINTNSSFVDATGFVLLRCLSNWTPGHCNLSVVIEEMRAAFQRETPLFTVSPLTPPTPAAAQLPAECPLQTGNCSAQKFLDPYGQYGPEAGLLCQAGTSAHHKVVLSSRAAPLSPAHTGTAPSDRSQDPQPSTSGGPGTKRSYVEELQGIRFEDVRGCTPSPCNPFLQDVPDANTGSSNLEDMSNLFKSLQLDNVATMYQLNHSNRGDPITVPEKQGPWDVVPEGQVLLDDRHKIEVNQLPLGLSPSRMRNKLTIYFQRQQNGGGEVLDVTYPAGQPDRACITFCHQRDAEQVLKQTERMFTVNKQDFSIQLKKFDCTQMPIPAGIPRDKVDMFRSLLLLKEQPFTPEEVLEAVQSCRDLPSALRYLSHECPICRERVSFSKIITMTHCSCAFCESCFKAYFSSVIKEKSIVAAVCPICNKPDVRGTGRWEEAMDFFNLLDTQIRHYLDRETHELFQRKLRDHALQEMPNFRWCAHCSFGLLHEANRLRMDCPSCGKSTCSKCRSPWVPQHEDLSCDKFKEWQLHNNPEYQMARLEQLLSCNKIDCPKCSFRFYLSKGGCLHFKCTQCQHEFCGGCSRPFTPGPTCGFSADCSTKGLHAHHPRDCLYHLRDWTVPRLQTLLQSHHVSYALRPPAPQQQRVVPGVCPVLEHRGPLSQDEECCGKPAPPEYSGYCTLHYKECLVELINKNRLDPAELFDRAEVEAELQRWRIPTPKARPQESEEVYLQRLRQVVKQQIKLAGDPVRAGNLWDTASNALARGLSPDSQVLLLLSD